MSNLPLEVISDILLLLPVKSLLRFKCLCKSINAIIGTKSFVSKRSFEGRISRKLIWVRSGASTYNGKLHVLDFENNFEQEFVFNETVLSHDKFMDECNGLLALYLLACDKACVWNPSTRHHRILPPFPFRPISLTRLTIGYDSSTDDYKIVALSNTSVWVFRLKSNSWSRACEDFPCDNVLWGGGSCFADGALHFFRNDTIVAFDVSRETFSIVAKPDTHALGDIVSLDCFGGYLSITMQMNDRNTLFVRKKDGVDFRWIKLYSVSTDGSDTLGYGKVVGYSKEEEKILIFASRALISCDLEKKRTERIGIEKTKEKNMWTSNFFLCSESFVSLGS